MSFQTAVTEDRRLVLLRLLAQSGGATAGAYLLQTALAGFGHHPSLDQVETDLAWLAEQGRVTASHPAGVTSATLTARGLDVSEGRATQPGVKRPRPGV